MFKKKKNIEEFIPPVAEQKEKIMPAYLRPDYPYQAIGDPITDLDSLVPTGVLYEIKCLDCEMSIRSQGVNITPTYERLMESGCIGCKSKNLIVRKVDTSKMPKRESPAGELQN